MSKERDDLAGLIFKGWTAQDPPPELHHRYTDTADAIPAAGWRAPAKVLSTEPELFAVPIGTKLLSPRTGEVWWPTGRSTTPWAGTGGGYTWTADLLREQGPLTVIHEGGA